MNMAATWELPVLYIIENNKYGMGTDIKRTTSVDHLWKRALASQMASARMERTTIDLADGTGRNVLRATGQVVRFPGFLELYQEGRDDDADEENGRLPAMAQGTPCVKLATSLGDIVLELDAAKAPKTVENFLQYVKEGHYKGTIFHRVIDGFMIQGGGFDAKMAEKKTRGPIDNEAGNGLKNDAGTLAMARTNQVHSATSQFFINLKGNDFLNYREATPDGYGYAVFGKVTKGMEVVERIGKGGFWMTGTVRRAGDGAPLPGQRIQIWAHTTEGKEHEPHSHGATLTDKNGVFRLEMPQIVPIFGQPNDARAVEVIQSVFPTRKAVGLMAKHLVYGLGTFHCMSQQQPSP